MRRQSTGIEPVLRQNGSIEAVSLLGWSTYWYEVKTRQMLIKQAIRRGRLREAAGLVEQLRQLRKERKKARAALRQLQLHGIP